MARRIKRLTCRRDGLNAEFAEDALQLLQREIYALDQTIRGGRAALRRLDRPFQIVDDRQQLLEDVLIAEPDLFPLIPLSKPLIVVELSRQSQVFIIE